ncbi:restriction endonuclease [Planctopirus hydrillae]|uniref:Restriction endonuclease type IV Mrr domain-containing protein n=1 Tax=Planctopirus hydrillae TaxID=1841610 RepID=A0A1C3ETL0_9PLAN|nr:restriction endonuclease [Planctopirus hydrillae]ODA36612.1 hypothetical protein A6X21_15875 [Planctopirus hydrillae]
MSDEKPKIIDLSQSKIVPWVSFEAEVAEYFEKSLPQGDWGLVANSASVRRKPAYYSKDRETDIVFDASVEVRPPTDSSRILLLWLIECKDYPDRNVNVDEIEEFHAKMMQVGAHKGTVFTRCGFASGAITFAKTHRIGLSVLTKEEHLIVQMSRSGGIHLRTTVVMPFCLDEGIESRSCLTHLITRQMHPFDILVPPVFLEHIAGWTP